MSFDLIIYQLSIVKIVSKQFFKNRLNCHIEMRPSLFWLHKAYLLVYFLIANIKRKNRKILSSRKYIQTLLKILYLFGNIFNSIINITKYVKVERFFICEET